MKNAFALSVTALCLFLSSCHRPVAYFLPTPQPAIDRQTIKSPTINAEGSEEDTAVAENQLIATVPVTASRNSQPAEPTHTRVERRMSRIQSMLSTTTEVVDKQPEPKPKPKPKNQLRLGNKIRQGLGIPLRKELNWWQRISWKLKASVIILLVAVLFAILQITILAIVFGVVGAFLMISGLKKSFKVKRPWF